MFTPKKKEAPMKENFLGRLNKLMGGKKKSSMKAGNKKRALEPSCKVC